MKLVELKSLSLLDITQRKVR